MSDSRIDDAAPAVTVSTSTPEPGNELMRAELETARNRREPGHTLWFTGLSGAGKTTLCNAVAAELLASGLLVEVIDGDVIRKHLWKDLGFDREARDENIYRIAFLSQMLTRNGVIVLVAAISPYREARQRARHAIGSFTEIYVKASLEICEGRDTKGLYRKARAGQLKGFTGIDDPYEEPLTPEVVCDTGNENVRESTNKILDYLRGRSVLKFRAGTSG
jgi:adenylylsulfate kinase